MNQVRFTTYGTSQRNADLTFGIGVVGITQRPPSINDIVYMLYSYEGRAYVFGRALVSLVIPRCNWPEDHEFVAYCQSEREIEYCSPIDVEELSISSICEIPWHLKKGQPVVDPLTISRIDSIFENNQLEFGRHLSFAGGESDNDPIAPAKEQSPIIKLWATFMSWLYDVNTTSTSTR